MQLEFFHEEAAEQPPPPRAVARIRRQTTGACREVVRVAMVPITFKNACAFISEHHRHHEAPQGHKFSLAVSDGEKVVGVAIVGRPVARKLDDGLTLEVTRLCTLLDAPKNTSSLLYAAARRVAKEMGFTRIITYVLASEPGTSLKACGWQLAAQTGGGSWDRSSRRRKDRHPTAPKCRWECLF